MSTGVAPHIKVYLAPSGQLAVEIPSPQGATQSTRHVELQDGKEAQTLLRLLHAQLGRKVQLGEDGAPTQAQVRHWERHDPAQGGYSDDRCAFCIAEGRAARRAVPGPINLLLSPRMSPKGAVTSGVRKIKPRARGTTEAKYQSPKSLAEII